MNKGNSDRERGDRARREYTAPVLTVYGSVPDRTLASDMGGSPDGTAMVIMQDTGKGVGKAGGRR